MPDHYETTAAQKKYNAAVMLWLCVYGALLCLATWVKYTGAIEGPAIYAVAILPALPIGAIILAMMRLIAESDEYLRFLYMRRYIAATGVTLFACAAIGFLSQFADFFRPPLWIVFPGYWMAYGLILPFMRIAR